MQILVRKVRIGDASPKLKLPEDSFGKEAFDLDLDVSSGGGKVGFGRERIRSSNMGVIVVLSLLSLR